MTKLLPCPFCGGHAIEEDGFLPAESIKYVYCSNIECGLHDVELGFVRSSWNKRAFEHDALLAEIERQRNQLENARLVIANARYPEPLGPDESAWNAACDHIEEGIFPHTDEKV